MSAEVPVIDGVVDLTVIGRGGSATVYRGHQPHLGRWVAVKVLDQALTDAAAAVPWAGWTDIRMCCESSKPMCWPISGHT